MPAAMHARRPMPRIVPAIPHRLSRAPHAARPLTPEESHKGALAQPPPPQHTPPTVAEQQPDAPTDEAPWTPDSQGEAQEDHKVNGHGDTTPRKLAVPIQLPPAFFPARPGTYTPPESHEAHSHQNQDQDQPQPRAQIQHQHQNQIQHQHQLSAGAVEFRSANDSPVLPATPRDIEPPSQAYGHTHAHAHALPPPPGFQYAPFFPAHAHLPSEVRAPWIPPLTAPPPAVFENGADYTVPHGGQFAKDTAFLNGAVAARSHSVNKNRFNEVKLGENHGEDRHAFAYQNGSAPAAPHLEDSAFELSAYLSTQFGNPEFADFILQIRSQESALVSVPVHGVVVVRSPVIAEAVRHSSAPSHRSRDAGRLLDVLVSDLFVTRESLEEAVKVLYGAPLLSAQNFLFGLAPYMYENEESGPSNDARRRMQQILSYTAAARVLQIPSMQARGFDITRMLIRWDTVDLVLWYALETNLGSRSKIDGVDVEDPFLAALLTSAIDFMAYTFPVDFQLYTIAPELRSLPRLPPYVEARPVSHNPRLSKIRFGDAPPETDVPPRHATGVLSSALLSLPLSLIDRLLNHRATANQVGWTGAVGLMRHVISERESRRQKAVQGQPKSTYQGPIPKALLDNLYMEERIEQVEPSPRHPSGHKLVAKNLPAED